MYTQTKLCNSEQNKKTNPQKAQISNIQTIEQNDSKKSTKNILLTSRWFKFVNIS